jgi:AraC-like DNA-binding protein
MSDWDRIDAVQRMQDYILAHFREEITLKDLAGAAHYSPWQALRAFSLLTGKTPFEYLREVRLSEAARALRDTGRSVLDVALDAAFNSHEGFTKAFSKKFGLPPERYRREAPPIPLFTYYSVRGYHKYLEGGAEMEAKETSVVFTQVIDRPARKVILKRGVKATDYFEYCGEVGCDVWGVLISVKGALYESIGMWLPEKLRAPGTSEYCQGVEVPADYSGPVPEGYDLIDLAPCKYLVFQGEPFEDERFEEAITAVWEAIDRFDPRRFGWEWAAEDGPRFQLEPRGDRGYIEARPVRPFLG